MMGIIMFIDFMDAAMAFALSSLPVSAWGMSFVLNHCVNADSKGMSIAPMARAMDPNSAGYQFFIMHQDAPHLDGQYAAFVKVFKGI